MSARNPGMELEVFGDAVLHSRPGLGLQSASESAGRAETSPAGADAEGCEERVAGITSAAVCVYPSRVCDAVKALKAAKCNIPVASVATGFPAGQTLLKTRLEEVRLAVEDGASEIDIVINRTLALTAQWEALYDEIRQFRKACGEAHMKTILAVGELGSFSNIYKASLVAMMAGSDFIKTSTGKEGVNATFPVAIVMVRAIREYFWKTGVKVGFMPAGGSRSVKDSLAWPGCPSLTPSLPLSQVGFMPAGGIRSVKDSLAWLSPFSPSLTPSLPLSQVGFMPAGGIRSVKDSLAWLSPFSPSLTPSLPLSQVGFMPAGGIRSVKDSLAWPGCPSLTASLPLSQVGFKPAGGISSAKDSLLWLSLIKEELGEEWLSPALFRLGASSLLSDIERQVGFKPAGGISSAKDSLLWLSLIKEELGEEWLSPALFRLGASSLLSDIERQIFHYVTGRYAAYHDLPMA
ncbi:UNVERIFIED_CONTAM: hypothetical protein FKN15_058003 [Acipenser sinensis]